MKITKMTGADIKADNGSGYNLAGAYPTRRFHDKTIYTVKYNGVSLDRSTVVSIERSRNGWGWFVAGSVIVETGPWSASSAAGMAGGTDEDLQSST